MEGNKQAENPILKLKRKREEKEAEELPASKKYEKHEQLITAKDSNSNTVTS